MLVRSFVRPFDAVDFFFFVFFDDDHRRSVKIDREMGSMKMGAVFDFVRGVSLSSVKIVKSDKGQNDEFTMKITLLLLLFF